MGLACRAAIADRLNPPKRVRRGRGGRRFHHRGTESTKICRGEDGLLSGCPRLIAFGDSASVRGNCLRMDVLQREEPRNARTTGERVLGYPKRNLRALWQRVSWSYGQDTICAKCDPLRSNDLPGELSLVLYVRSRVRGSNDWNSLGSGTIRSCFL